MRAAVAQSEDKLSKNTFAKTYTGFGKVGSEPGEEPVIIGAFKEPRVRNREQCLVMQREVRSETQDVWQIVEKLLEGEIKQRLTVLTQVDHALTHLALSGNEQAEFLEGPRLLVCQRAERGSLDPVQQPNMFFT